MKLRQYLKDPKPFRALQRFNLSQPHVLQYLLLVGGWAEYGSNVFYNDVYKFDVVDQTWRNVSTIKEKKAMHAMTVMNIDEVINYCV